MHLSVLQIYAIVIVFIFSGLMFALYKEEEKVKKLAKDRELKQKQRIYELAILKEIQERIGYELDIERVVDVITGSLRNLLDFSNVSSLILKNDKAVFKSHTEEIVSRKFIEDVKQRMIASLTELNGQTMNIDVENNITGIAIDDQTQAQLGSYFHIPIFIDTDPIGIITISSTKPNFYAAQDVTILYQIVNQVANSVAKLKGVLSTEKGKLMATIGSLADGVFMVDTNNQLVVINNTAKRMLHIEKAQPTIIDVLGILQSKYDIASKIQQAVMEKNVIEEKEVPLQDKVVQIFITPVADSKTDHIIGASVLLHDITLEKSIAKMKEDFTNIMVHELRAPITAIKDASKLLASNTMKLPPEQESKMLALIHEQAERLLNEVGSLLDAARLEAGRFVIQKQEMDINTVIDEKLNFFQAQAEGKQIHLSSHVSSNVPKIYADPVRIGQVLNNLMSNALKFTPEHGKITISAIQKNPEQILVSVNDTGMGIPKEKQGTLFSRFAQVHGNGQVTNVNSSGLGLFIVKGIVEAHGGTIMLLSEEGHGTTISFTLPIHKQAEDVEQPKPASAIPQPIIPASQLVH